MVSAFLLLILILAVVVGPFVWRVRINDIDIVAGMQGPRSPIPSAPTISDRTSSPA